LHVVCKGDCDKTLERRLVAQGYLSRWEDIGDLINPIFFLKNMLTYMNSLYAREDEYSPNAHKHMKDIYIALAQRTLREVTKDDEERFRELGTIEGL
jgi:hypothetical protein